jgi:hypothetical protein
MNQVFSYGQIKATFGSTTDKVLMDAARYQVRLNQSRPGSASKELPAQNISRFSLILAHLIDTTGFSFAIPDPLAHTETVGLAWDAYMTADTDLWDQLFSAINISANVVQEIEARLPAATEEFNTLSVHHYSPFKRKPQKAVKQSRR